ncbi:MAG: alpha-mannosidase [Bacteroidales bacterium]|nr:MAG: alpha-mannosidase [Bacteroidales bacterium]
MTSKTLILVCNAHLDPVWLWEWEEGVAETLATFRIAAKFCREYEAFIFCHNEALLYRYVEDYEPDLFEEIRKLIRRGRWKVIGGWFLQPDCNMPSGEALVRQILTGRRYFRDKFNIEPETAVNFDPFGHSRGLVQILKKSGYTSYLFCRPDHRFLDLPDLDFIWVGYDGSEIMAHRPHDHYNSGRGLAVEKIKNWLGQNRQREYGIVLWGIGNHGGGPSREDLEEISELQNEISDREILHGYPEQYFEFLRPKKRTLGRVERDINPFAVGCYTSMQRVKKKYRQLENLYFLTEKLSALATLQGLQTYPKKDLAEALEDMLFGQFHDVLPGSSIRQVEEYAIQRINHGMEILERIKSRAFMSFLSGHTLARENEFPLMIFNPHPHDVHETIIMEFQAPEPNFDEDLFQVPEIKDMDGKIINSQLEKESSNIVIDHRKRVVFKANLNAFSMNRFSCYLKRIPSSNGNKTHTRPSDYKFPLKDGSIWINPDTGLIDKYEINGQQILLPDSGRFLVMDDNADPWGMTVRSFRKEAGKFTLLSAQNAAEFAGVDNGTLPPVRIIEDGAVRTVVEALFGCDQSCLSLRYKVPKYGNELEMEARIYWFEKDKMLKLSFLTGFEDGHCFGEVVYGVEHFNRNGDELVAQRWVGVDSESRGMTFSVINDTTYGLDYNGGELRLSLLRSPAYSGHPVKEGQPIAPQDRFEPRIDQGERHFRFWLNAGMTAARKSEIPVESRIKNEFPICLCSYPSGKGPLLTHGLTVSDPVVQLAAFKISEDGKMLVLRLFEPSGMTRESIVEIPVFDLSFPVRIPAFSIRTIGIDLLSRQIIDLDLMEKRISSIKYNRNG